MIKAVLVLALTAIVLVSGCTGTGPSQTGGLTDQEAEQALDNELGGVDQPQDLEGDLGNEFP